MAFSEATITSIARPRYANGQVYLGWTCSSAPGSVWFQVYLGGALSWWGQSTSCWLLAPSSVVSVAIGTVSPGEEQTSFAADLAAAPSNRATLSWLGGTFESATIAGFFVYGESAPGAGISYATPLATIAAYPGGIVLDGWDLGGYGSGGWGEAAGSYSWTSAPLLSGTWHFAVVPFDAAGNAGVAALTSQWISVPPSAPPLLPNGARLDSTYSASTFEATLTWGASI